MYCSIADLSLPHFWLKVGGNISIAQLYGFLNVEIPFELASGLRKMLLDLEFELGKIQLLQVWWEWKHTELLTSAP